MSNFVTDKVGYLKDSWNVIDIASLGTNFCFLSMTIFSIVTDSEYYEIYNILGVGAMACFFMQFKMFYWMRLFPSLAYYVKLIQ